MLNATESPARCQPSRAFVGALAPLLPPLADQPRNAMEAALRLAADGVPVFPAHPEGTLRLDKNTGERVDISKTPAIPRWQFDATTDPAQVRRWWGRTGKYRRCGVSIGLRLAQLMAMDFDTPESAEEFARELVEHGGVIVFAIASAKGVKILYRRPARLADENGAKTRQEAVGGADVVMGNVLAWTPGRIWYGDPSAIGEAPPWLLEALAVVYPERPALAPPPPRPALSAADDDRCVAYARPAIRAEADTVAGLGDGRKMGMHALGIKLGAIVAGVAPQLEAEAWQEAERACIACGLALRVGMQHFANGWRYGFARPRPAPTARELGLGALPPQEREALEDRAGAAAADVVEILRAAGVRPVAAARAAAAARILAGLALDRGGDTVPLGYRELGAHLHVAPGTAAKVGAHLELCGWTVTPGGIAEDNTVTATRWTMPKIKARRALVKNCTGLVVAGPRLCESPSKNAPKGGAGDLARGLRGRRTAPTPGAGAGLHPTLHAMADGKLRTAAELGRATGLHPQTAARIAAAATARGVATQATVNTRGRPARAWAMTAEALAAFAGVVADGIGDGLRQVLEAGRAAASRVYARVAEERQILAWARRQGDGLASALASLRARAAALGGAFSTAGRRWMVAATVPDDDRRRMALAEVNRELAGSRAVADARRQSFRADVAAVVALQARRLGRAA